MGQAKNRGNFEERKEAAVAAGRIKKIGRPIFGRAIRDYGRGRHNDGFFNFTALAAVLVSSVRRRFR